MQQQQSLKFFFSLNCQLQMQWTFVTVQTCSHSAVLNNERDPNLEACGRCLLLAQVTPLKDNIRAGAVLCADTLAHAHELKTELKPPAKKDVRLNKVKVTLIILKH